MLIGAAFLNQATIHLVRPTTTYKLLELDAGPDAVGVVTALYGLLPLIVAMPLGAHVQRSHRLKLILAAGSLLVMLGAAGVSAASGLVLVGAGTTLLGLGHLVFTIAGQAMIARFAEDCQLDRGFGWFEAGFAMGQMLGPLLGGVLLGSSAVASESGGIDVDGALWVGTALSAPAALLLLGALRVPGDDAVPSVSKEGSRPGKPMVFRLLRQYGMPSHLLASFAVVAVLDIMAAFLPLLGDQLGVAPALVGALLATRAAATILSRFLLPALRKRFSRGALVLASLWVSAGMLILPPFVLQIQWMAYATMAVAGFFLGLGQPLTMSLVVQAVPAEWRSSALSLRLVANRIGQVAVPLVAGTVAAPLGPASAIWLSSGVLTLSGLEKLIRKQ